MSNQKVDHVSLRISKKLARLSSTHSERCIFRVHDQLRKENEEAYEPTTVSIGPYHYGKSNLKVTEEHKLQYLQQILELNNDLSVDRYVTAMRDLEERARKCYADPISISNDEFIEMMLLDGCFIIHFFRRCMFKEIRDIDPNDYISQYALTRRSIRYDLMLFENQLPLFVVECLLDMIKYPNPKDNIIDLALHCLAVVLPTTPHGLEACVQVSTANVHHILGLIHAIWCSSFVGVVPIGKQGTHEEKWEFIKCTTELEEAGIMLKKSTKRSISLLDIKFENGVLEIPYLHIGADTERIFRNLILYEQYSQSTCPKYVTDYTRFMVCLINSSKDVGKLRDYGIITNWSGDDEAVSAMFKKLCYQLWISKNFCYSQVFKKVNRHYRQRRNIWLANLRWNYFNSPWSIISFLAAAMLLILTLLQTAFSYHK